MTENSNIEWTTHTFNPWIGCQKVGPGCDHCYAETWDSRGLQQRESRWGPHAARTRTSAGNWSKPLAWNRAADGAAERPRVFCASLADVFDNHPSVDPQWRQDLWALIKATPNLDWMLLTKRPGNIAKMLPDDWGTGYSNVWLGCTVVNQEEADRDIPKLLDVPAAVHFLSMEPLLGPVDLLHLRRYNPKGEPWINALRGLVTRGQYLARSPNECSFATSTRCIPPELPAIDLVIVGGESGKKARPMHPDWARSLRDQCVAAGTAFFFKQWGEWAPAMHDPEYGGHVLRQTEPVGPFDSWKANAYDPDRLEGVNWRRIGKKAAGRMLDGRTWDEMPQGDPQ